MRANLEWLKLVQSYLSGLLGNTYVHHLILGRMVSWAGEVAAATDSAGDFSEVTSRAKETATHYVDVSKQFLIQDSASAEEM